MVARGFASPGDAITWRRLLPKLLDPAEADALLTAWSEGTITTVALSGPEPEELEWTGDVATNPILRHQLDRELGERDFRIDMLRGQPVALAQAYRERGQLHGRAGRHEAALADFAAAARLPHRDPVLGMARAVVLGDLQRDEEAEAAFKEILRTRPDRERAELALGAFRFGQGRYEEARTHFRTEAQRDPATGRPAILADLSARRAGGTERRLVAKALEQVSPDSWDAHRLGYLQGGINEENLLRRAREGGELTVASQLSEAYFLLAQTSLASGDQASAVAHLESCISTGMTGMIEFRLARLELRRLAPDREARLRGATESTATPPRTPAAAKEAGEGSEDAASAGSTPA